MNYYDELKHLSVVYTKNATSGTPLIIGDTFTTFIADANFNNSDVYDMVQLERIIIYADIAITRFIKLRMMGFVLNLLAL